MATLACLNWVHPWDEGQKHSQSSAYSLGTLPEPQPKGNNTNWSLENNLNFYWKQFGIGLETPVITNLRMEILQITSGYPINRGPKWGPLNFPGLQWGAPESPLEWEMALRACKLSSLWESWRQHRRIKSHSLSLNPQPLRKAKALNVGIWLKSEGIFHRYFCTHFIMSVCMHACELI